MNFKWAAKLFLVPLSAYYYVAVNASSVPSFVQPNRWTEVNLRTPVISSLFTKFEGVSSLMAFLSLLNTHMHTHTRTQITNLITRLLFYSLLRGKKSPKGNFFCVKEEKKACSRVRVRSQCYWTMCSVLGVRHQTEVRQTGPLSPGRKDAAGMLYCYSLRHSAHVLQPAVTCLLPWQGFIAVELLPLKQ